MKKRPKVKSHPLVGTWVEGEGGFSEVEMVVSRRGSRFHVVVVDRYDNERAEVYDVKWDGEELTFAAHWPSTGRFVKTGLSALTRDAVNYRYTYSEQETWHRKKK